MPRGRAGVDLVVPWDEAWLIAANGSRRRGALNVKTGRDGEESPKGEMEGQGDRTGRSLHPQDVSSDGVVRSRR